LNPSWRACLRVKEERVERERGQARGTESQARGCRRTAAAAAPGDSRALPPEGHGTRARSG
jgi:hypothetical protein